ncbi:MAG TPA: threonine/serine exporter family protein [Bacilli bacterium]|nr:threonine/serine exporter family protein [Bacilli bacterium]
MKQERITKVCLLAGEIMLKNGAETYRIEDTMTRIAQAYGVEDAQIHATPTAIMFAEDMTSPTNFVRINVRATDLDKVSKVNSISRHISAGKLTVKEAREKLLEVEANSETYPKWLQIAAAGFASGCFTIMFQGSWLEFLPAIIVGMIGYYSMLSFHEVLKIRFFAEFLASVFLALSAFLVIMIHSGLDIDKIIIGSVMPLVPGLLITNAVRDLMAGHLVSGITKATEAILTALAIGAGVAVVLLVFY